VYQGQWIKRKAYYKKCAYKITDGKESKESQTKEPETNHSEKVIPDTIPIVKGRCMMVD